MASQAWWAAHRVLLYLLVLVTAALAAYGLTVSLRGSDSEPGPAAVSTPAALKAALATPSAARPPATPPVPRAAAVASRLARPAAASALGGRLLAHVVDAASGAVLYDTDGARPAAPASTGKLLTAAAILTVHRATDTLGTKVVAGTRAGTVVLVGGGDPTLTGAAKGKPGAYPDAARVADLAAQLHARGLRVQRIVVDGSLFTGPAISPDWDPADLGTSYGSAITALMVDGARRLPTDVARSVTPAEDAGHALAARLGHADIPGVAGTAPPSARTLATVRSAPISTLVDQMLQTSDNTIADVLARDVAVARHGTASFRGGAAAIRATLAGLGVQVGAGMRDGSGLASADRVSPVALAGVLRLISGASGPATDVRDVLDAMPVGGWSGTLAARYGSGASAALAGRVRAKTGTLTGVSSLAGVVRDESGRLLVFSFDADRAPPGGAFAADRALDGVVTALARCGCT